LRKDFFVFIHYELAQIMIKTKIGEHREPDLIMT
jgi:hypothetical protein